MGKIRVTTLGSEEEKELQEKRKVQREEKKKREKAEKVHTVGAQSEAEIDKMVKLAREVEEIESGGVKTEKDGVKKKKQADEHKRGKNYQQKLLKLDHKKLYPIDQGVSLLREVSFAKFDPTVELHINTTEKGLRGAVNLPHGTGKKVRVAIATEENADKLVKEISEGKINFDALVAHPKAVPKLAKVAKFLGPRGLMPNPKNGTISPEPEKVAKKLEGGEVNWKTESEFPIIHATIGKLSFKDNQLTENYKAFVGSVGTLKIEKIVLKSTMSPGIKIQFA